MFEIGNSLREARVRQHLELTEVELATKIRARYLRALEEESFGALPAQTYVKGFLRTYADYLGLDGQLYVDEFNSRFGDGDEPREPVVARRTSQVRRQHRGLERRWVAFALAGIAALVVFVIAAWKFGGATSDQIPNLGTTPSAKKPLKPASPTAPVKTQPLSFRLYVRAVSGNCWMDVRNWSASGKSRFTGTVELGQSQRFVARRLWVSFGTPGNLAIAYNGKVVRLPRAGAYLFTPRGVSRAA
ncbi:MAG TPA: RodZ domain-containing protein [Gaiellaceae bacterium]|nr:RodZ domain-containing protein [Gaiellaceae bacterium]